ncbi:MAG: metal-sulfur cluster assembly factor [Planctomycetales bacterium]
MSSEDPKPTTPEATLPVVTDSPAPTDAPATGENPAAEKPAGPPPDEAALINALKEVVDPELMINIVDLGLVYAVRQNDNQVDVDMTLTSPACPAGPQILQQSKMALEKLSGVTTANIKLVMTPPWSPDRMTDEARDQLGIF